MEDPVIAIAGATGALGGRVSDAVLRRGGAVRAIVRINCDPAKVQALRTRGATVVEVDFRNIPELTKACAGASCVVSALSGLR